MAQITFQGNPVQTSGTLPVIGCEAPEFELTTVELATKSLADYAGKKVVLNIFPSLDTPVCAMSVRRFNQDAAGIPGVVVLCISVDLPFAMARFCAAEGIEGVEMLSAFRSPAFGSAYGVTLEDSPLAGLLGRAVIILDEDGKVTYAELVPEIAQEPNYDAALTALK